MKKSDALEIPRYLQTNLPIQVKENQDPLMRRIRYLDKFADGSAKGRPIAKFEEV